MIFGTVSVVLLIWMLWFIVPMLKTVYNNEMLVVNASSPMVAQVIPVASMWFTILPIFLPLVGGFIILMYAVRYRGDDWF